MQDKIVKCLGLVDQYNPLTLQPGALSAADDIYIRRENIIEPRRGNALYATKASNVSQFLPYLSKIIAHNGTTLSYDNGSGTFSDVSGSYSAPASSKIRGLEAFSNLYFTTSLGVKVLSALSSTAARLSGAPRSLDPSYTLTGASGFLATAFQCAYRVVIQRTDAQSVVVTGYPSQRLWVTNTTGGARNVILTTYLPSECVAGDVVQVYRTIQASGTASDTAGDEMGLVYQYSLVAGDISAGFFSFTDPVTDDLRGATLYTSPSQQGIAQANDRPPLAKDIALYKSKYMLYGSTQTKQRLFATLVGTASLTGKTIVLGGVTYNFGASEIISGGGSPQVLVSATGVAAVDIDLTARSLVRVINRYAGNTTIYAYYLSGPGDLPGLMLFEEKGIGAAAFTAQASDTAISGMFFPAPPVSPSTSVKSTSSNSVQKNALFYAKDSQPEHTTLTSFLPVGPSNKEILRVISLRDSAIIIKEEGVYRLTGETPQSFTIVPVDLTVFCKSADSVVALSNQVFMLSNQGVVAISENGVEVVSHQIERRITPLFLNSNLANITCGMAYETERSYFLSTISQSGDSVQNQTLVYNLATKTWVKHKYAFTAAVVPPDVDKMFFAKPSSALIYRERKVFDDTDFADPEIAVTFTAISGNYVTFSISGSVPAAGWVLSQGSVEIAIQSLATVPGGYQALMIEDVPSTWATGAATIYPPVGGFAEWHSWTAEHPEALKQVRAIGMLTDDTAGVNTVRALTVAFSTNFDQETANVTINRPQLGWGYSWGTFAWGGSSDSSGYPTWVPLNKQYCNRMRIGVYLTNARERASISGVVFSYEAAGDRMGR